MALIIEDGSIVAGANSFATVAECRAYCDLRGLALPTDDSDVEPLLITASDFLFSLEGDYQGNRSDSSQVLVFPRSVVYLFGADVSDTIPQILKDGQCRLAFDATQQTLLATGDGRVIKKEGVGPLQVEYGDDGASNPQANLTAALTILDPLFNNPSNGGGGGANFTVCR